MKKLKKGIVLSLALCLSMAAFSGCTDADKDADSSPSATPSASSSATPSASASPTETAVQSLKEITAAKEKVKLTMVLCDAGLTAPDGIDVSDNDWVNLVKDLANVELSIDQPVYADYDTKLQLRLSSNDLPDIVHCIGSSLGTAKNAAMEGAFVPLTDYYNNSVNVKNVINEEQMTWAASTDGIWYNVPMSSLKRPAGSWISARWDLVSKYNNDKWPETVPEWIDLFNKIKTEMPEALVLSNRLLNTDYALNYGGRVIYTMYGLHLGGAGGDVWDYDNQKVESEFLTPEYRAASKVMRELYENGVLDKEFVTTDSSQFTDKLKTKNVVANFAPSNAIVPTKTTYADYPEGNSQIWRMAAPLKEFPAEVRYPELAYGAQTNGINSHGMFIAASCKNPDRAWDVLEALASEEVLDFCIWGIEGTDFEMKGEERVPITTRYLLDKTDPNCFNWQRQYLVIWGYDERIDYTNAVAEQEDAEFAKAQLASIEPIVEAASKQKKTPLNLPGFIRSETASRKVAESKSNMSTITINYIMGKISDADFDKQIAEWKETYGFIAEEQTEYINSYDKNEAAKLGVSYTLH